MVWVTALCTLVCCSEILSDIAEDKYEYWSSFAPLPLEVVISAGQKARDNCSTGMHSTLIGQCQPFHISLVKSQMQIRTQNL